jgi:hypothetical protein
VKDSFYEELECVCNKFPKYYMKTLLEDFNADVGRVGYESLYAVVYMITCIRIISWKTTTYRPTTAKISPNIRSNYIRTTDPL